MQTVPRERVGLNDPAQHADERRDFSAMGGVRERSKSDAALGGVRGVMCLFVIFSHLDAFIGALASPTSHYSQDSFVWHASRLLNGNFAVCVFYVLSGYVLLLVFSKDGEYRHLSSGFAKRYFRLTPVALSSLLLAYCLQITIGFHNREAAYAIGGHEWLSRWYASPFSLLDALKQGTWGIYRKRVFINFPLWSLWIELWASLFLYAFAALFFKYRKFWLIALLSMIPLIAIFRDNGLYASLFLVGAIILRYPRLRAGSYLIILAAFLEIQNPWTDFIGVASSDIRKIGIVPTIDIDTWCHAIAASLFVMIVLKSPLLIKILSTKLCKSLGDISYSLYACHVPVMMSVGAWILVFGASRGHLHAASGAAIVATFIISIALAAIITRLIDIPSQRIASKFGSWLTTDRISRKDGMIGDGASLNPSLTSVSNE